MTRSFYSNGKLLLTGEYAVLDGALSLAVPTRYGQSLSVEEIASSQLQWKSWENNGMIWFEQSFDVSSPEHTFKARSSPAPRIDHISAGSNDHDQNKFLEGRAIAETLSKILREAHKLNPDFLRVTKGYVVEAKLTFPRDWGLGSSSTLINNIAQWAEVNAYELLWNAFSGSGYDIACAQNDHPILYSLKDGKPDIAQVDFNPPFQDKLYFIHLNKKQNSGEGCLLY